MSNMGQSGEDAAAQQAVDTLQAHADVYCSSRKALSAVDLDSSTHCRMQAERPLPQNISRIICVMYYLRHMH